MCISGCLKSKCRRKVSRKVGSCVQTCCGVAHFGSTRVLKIICSSTSHIGIAIGKRTKSQQMDKQQPHADQHGMAAASQASKRKRFIPLGSINASTPSTILANTVIWQNAIPI